MTAKKFYSDLRRKLERRNDVTIKRYTLRYKNGEYDFLRIASKRIGAADKVILIRAGIHGYEIAGPLTILSFCNKIIDYVHQAGLKVILYPLGNPYGFEEKERYHKNYDKHKYGEGNNDFVRYELKSGRIVGDIGGERARYEKWYWSSDPELEADLPEETKLMHRLLKNDLLFQIKAVIDLHQDCETSGLPPAAYHYAFGDFSAYNDIIANIEKLVPIIRDTEIDAGEASPEKSDSQGFIVRYDGSITDLLYRLGVKHSITVETTEVTPLDIAKEINLIWIFGIVDMVKGELDGT